ncbi:hypothetical protein IWW50_003418 [Coemansia erecta]|nr:hypothetical protein IWW50_003418 [Coemansia erecta]
MIKHTSDCIDSLAGLIQIIDLMIKGGIPMPSDLRKTLELSMELSVTQTKKFLGQTTSNP